MPVVAAHLSIGPIVNG